MKKQTSKAFAASIDAFKESFGSSFGSETLVIPKKGVPYQVIPTGSIALDIATGVGGYVEGRITELYGQPDGGKTMFCFLSAAEAQKKYPQRLVAFIDVEQKFDANWAESLGVDLSRMMVYVPQTAEDVSDATKKFLESPLFCMVIVDSVGAMMSKVEQQKKADEDVVASTARIVTRMVKHATTFAPTHGAVVLVVNQIRNTIGGYGANITTPGGWALKHSSTMRLKFAGSDKQPVLASVKGNRIPVGKEISIKVERNKVSAAGAVARPFLVTVPTEKYGPVGVDQAMEAFDAGLASGLIAQRGAMYTLPTGETIKGRDAVIAHFREAMDEALDIRQRVVSSSAPATIDEPEELPEEDPETDPETDPEDEPEVEVLINGTMPVINPPLPVQIFTEATLNPPFVS